MTIDRRSFLRIGAAAGVATLNPMAIWGRVARGDRSEATERQMGVLATVSDLLYPKTDTPQGSALLVPAFVALALQHGLDGSTEAAGSSQVPGGVPVQRHVNGLWVLDAFEALLDGRAGGNFLRVAPAGREATLTAIDADAFAPGGEASPWHVIKDLMVLAYCSSEVGSSQYLQYELVPGHWDPDLPLPADNRAFSSDWTARDFG